jgi:plastocyanin
MHCHVLHHMMSGMMGSLLVIQGGEPALPLAKGMHGHCHVEDQAQPNTIVVGNDFFQPATLNVSPGSMVMFDFQGFPHTVTTPAGQAVGGVAPIELNGGGGQFDAVPAGQTRHVVINGTPGTGRIDFQCGIHGSAMKGTIRVV